MQRTSALDYTTILFFSDLFFFWWSIRLFEGEGGGLLCNYLVVHVYILFLVLGYCSPREFFWQDGRLVWMDKISEFEFSFCHIAARLSLPFQKKKMFHQGSRPYVLNGLKTTTQVQWFIIEKVVSSRSPFFLKPNWHRATSKVAQITKKSNKMGSRTGSDSSSWYIKIAHVTEPVFPPKQFPRLAKFLSGIERCVMRCETEKQWIHDDWVKWLGLAKKNDPECASESQGSSVTKNFICPKIDHDGHVHLHLQGWGVELIHGTSIFKVRLGLGQESAKKNRVEG